VLFEQCDYILGKSGSVVLVVPAQLPKEETIMLEIHTNGIIFRYGDEELANLPLPRQDVLQALVNRGRVGIVEYVESKPSFPAYISAVAHIEVMREVA
jgi:hypothetical protein